MSELEDKLGILRGIKEKREKEVQEVLSSYQAGIDEVESEIGELVNKDFAKEIKKSVCIPNSCKLCDDCDNLKIRLLYQTDSLLHYDEGFVIKSEDYCSHYWARYMVGVSQGIRDVAEKMANTLNCHIHIDDSALK